MPPPPLTLDPLRLNQIELPLGTSWLLGACMEARGKQDLWTQQKPEILTALRQQAIVQSAESSNRIEGVTVPLARLRPLILGNARPRDRSEKELAGYRRALNWIFSRKGEVLITPELIRKLHARAQGGSSGDAGLWKARDNEIIEILPNGERRIRFVPVSAKQTPTAIARLCSNYARACQQQIVPPLLIVATFVFDLLCIHPFRDGNGRVSRLITALLLQVHGFEVSRYVSLERLIEESKEDYYRVLDECSLQWGEGQNQILPWWNYFLGIVRFGYKDFALKIENAAARPAKSDLAQTIILDQTGEFTLNDIVAQAGSISPQLIKKVLAKMKLAGRVQLKGRGRSARWILTFN